MLNTNTIILFIFVNIIFLLLNYRLIEPPLREPPLEPPPNELPEERVPLLRFIEEELLLLKVLLLLLLFVLDLLNKLVFLFVCLLIVETFPALSVPGFVRLTTLVGLLYLFALLE
jgi:uncharacterized membrane protein